MTRNDLAQLSREELIELVLKLHNEVEAMRLKLEKGKKPPTNSSNSSQPPSRDQKGNMPAERKKRRHGPPVGHPKHERKFIAQPDRVVEVVPRVCHVCHTDLSQETMVLKDVNQITELPVSKAEVIEVRRYAVVCPCCCQQQTEEPPAGLEMERTFGARLEATVVYYRQEQHISYERTQKVLRDLHGVTLSQGGIDQIMQRTGQKAIREVKTIQEKVCQSAVINSDETGCRVDSSNWWQWVFCTMTAVLHVIRFNRSSDVIKAVMGEHQAEVWVSDCLRSQMKAPARQRQICMAHQLRNLQAVIDCYPTAFWAQAMQALFRYAIHLHHQRDQLPPAQFQSEVARIERLCNQLIKRPLIQAEACKLQRRYLKHRQKLFVFLYRSDVEPTNNVAERALRPSVIHRKVIGCFRSDWGAKAYAALESVIDTAAISGIDAFRAIQTLIGQPSIPLPLGCE
jgi:transposase